MRIGHFYMPTAYAATSTFSTLIKSYIRLFQIGLLPLYYAVVNEDLATARCLIRSGAKANQLNKVCV